MTPSWIKELHSLWGWSQSLWRSFTFKLNNRVTKHFEMMNGVSRLTFKKWQKNQSEVFNLREVIACLYVFVESYVKSEIG